MNSNEFQSGTNVFLRVKVTNATGNMEFAFFTVAIISPANQHTSCFQYLTGGPVSEAVSTVKAFPNPFGSSLQISFVVAEDEAITDIRIFTITGLNLARINRILLRGEHVEEVSLGGFAAGPLLLQVRIGDKVHNQLVIKK